MTRTTWGLAAFVVAVVFGIIGVSNGLAGNHQAAVPAVGISIAALLLGSALVRK